MSTIDILSPAALGPADAHPLSPRLPALAGRVLGLRVDRAWHSFLVFADEVRALAAPLAPRDVVVFDPDTRIGTPEAESAKVAAFARTVDAAVVGLGT
jgi:hypothetical protein